MTDRKTGLALFAHGSRMGVANEAVVRVAAELARRGGFAHVEACFLELAQPDLPGAVERLVGVHGCGRVVVLPYFLTMGIHLQRDLPGIVEELRGIYPSVEFEITEPLDGHPALVDILMDRAEKARKGESR